MRYPVLRLVVAVLYLAALLVGYLGARSALDVGPVQTVQFFVSLGAVVAALLLVATAESLRVLLDIEANTRGQGGVAAVAELGETWGTREKVIVGAAAAVIVVLGVVALR